MHKIIQINTYDIQGGAARAAYRLHKGLLQIGEDCRMLVKHKASDDNTVEAIRLVNADHSSDKHTVLFEAIQECYINAHRSEMSNTLFSFPYPGYDIAKLPLVQEADILNLHWVAFYQSPVTLQKLFSLKKPVVWTLHDQWAFTGGCHYSAGCRKYTAGCSRCPQLADDPFDLAAAILKDKLELFNGANLTIVTPSHWLAQCARESALFGGLRVEVIPNSLETDLFFPIPKPEAKQTIDIGTDTTTLLFGAESGDERRKGFRELAAAIQRCKTDSRFQELLRAGKLRIICFGWPNKDLEALGIPVVSLGYLTSDAQIRLAYSAADIFVLPSLEDNLPNTMLEALSCETPVISFNIGGIPDVIEDGVNGRLVPADEHEMGKAVVSLIFDPKLRVEMGRKGRQKMVERYSLETQASKYISLFEDLQTNKPSHTLSSDIPSITRN